MREVLNERLKWLDDYDRTNQALQKVINPDPSPETQRNEAKAELLRLQEIFNQTAVSADPLLPPVFRNSRAIDVNALASEMRNALEAERNDLKQWEGKLETLRMEIAKSESSRNTRRTERDKLFQRVATLKAKSAEFEERVAAALTSEGMQLAHEKLVNFQWESRVESLRLRLIEAELALERRIAGVRELSLQICQTQAQISEKRRNRMEERYKAIVERQEQDLSRAAASEETKARHADDPLVGLKARRTAELLSLEAQVIKSEQVLATTPSPSLHEERERADRAEADFAEIKQLLDDGDVSRLDAVRLNNDFRRIALERERLLRDEKTAVEAHLQFYEEALTNTEIELLSDSSSDRFDRDLLRDRLPQSKWLEGEGILGELEAETSRPLGATPRHLAEALRPRFTNPSTGRSAVGNSRRGIWLHPNSYLLGSRPRTARRVALGQGGREIPQLIRGGIRLAQETANLKLWGQPSGEFLAMSAAIALLPFGLVRLRRAIRRLLESELGR